jgi:GNAT superfamily N-acetyltransferase
LPQVLDQVDLREAESEDLPFLFSLYCDVRGPEVDGWGWPASQRDAFLRMQFEAQQRSYSSAYLETRSELVLSGDVAIGRRLVARTAAGIQLIDIALLAAHRNRGIGRWLIQRLMDECRRNSEVLTLQVLQGNPAQRLYQRMGLRETSADAMYIQMEWAPGSVLPD